MLRPAHTTVAALVAPLLIFATASTGQDDADQKSAAVVVACTEIWATDTVESLEKVVAELEAMHEGPLDAAYSEAYAASEDYLIAADEYRGAYVATINAVLDLAGKAGNQALYEKAWDEGSKPHLPQTELDGLIDNVIDGEGLDVLTHVTDLLVSDAKVDEALRVEHEAKQKAIATRRVLLEADAKASAIEIVLFAIDTCEDDQRKYLTGAGPDPAS